MNSPDKPVRPEPEPARPAPGLVDTIDRMPDDAPMLESRAVRAGRLDDTPPALVSAYLKSQPILPQIGAVIAERWRIERLLGEGGFGAVFEGRDQQLGRKVAIKVLRAETRATDAMAMREAITHSEERRRRFREEARAVARAESPNVVTVYDVGEHAGDGEGTSWPFLVLEFIEGTPLDRVVRERPTLEVALHVLEQLALGVAMLHSRRVVHRDLKPANAILTSDGRVKIIDFGLAIATSDWTEIKGPKAQQDWIEGTPQYMSPEITRGGEPDLHSDLWALGVIGYELMSGRSPWGENTSLIELERRIAHEEPAPLVPRSGGDAASLAHVAPIIAKALAKRPSDRFLAAADVVQALADLRAHRTRVAAPSREAEQPFRYLLAFEEKDAAWFFGREEVTAKLVLALEQRGRLVIAGPSGAGKTSLIQAGLIPELKVLRPLEVLRLQPGRDPLRRLAALIPSAPNAVTADDIRRQPGLVGERLRQHAKTTKTRILVLVDALEELITQHAPAADVEAFAQAAGVEAFAQAADVEAFAQALDGLRDDAARGVLLVMAVRDEYLGRLPRLSRALESTLRDAEFLGPPPRESMIAALTRPVSHLGYTWQEGFPEEMVAAVSGHASPLPVLQLAASWVWEKCRDAVRGPGAEKVLVRASLAGEGEALRIGEVLGQYADHKLRAASWSEADRGLVKRMLPVMVSAEGTPLLVPIEEIVARCPASARARGHELLRDLTDFRLLTSLRDERARECLTPVHTTLIRGWGLLREALEGSAELEAFMRRFERDARDWEASGRDPAKLWPAAALRDFERWAAPLREVQVSSAQVAFRAAVAAFARRARWLRWGLVGVLAALALVGTWAGLAFSAQADEAHVLREEALSQKNLAESQTRSSEKHRRQADALVDFMLGDLRQRLEPLGQVKLLRVVAEKASAYLNARQVSVLERGARLDNEEDAARRAAVLRNLSAVFFEEGDTTAAEKAAREALAITERLAANAPKDPHVQSELADSLGVLGELLVARGEATAGIERYQAGLAIYVRLAAEHPDELAVVKEIAWFNDRLGDVYTSRGELDAALSAQRAALAATERLVAAEPENERARRNLLIVRSKVGAAPSEMIGEIGAARASEAELLAFKALAEANPTSALAQRDLGIGYIAVGDGQVSKGALEPALESYRAAQAIARRLAEADPSSAQAQRDLAFCDNKVGAIRQRIGDPEGAVREHEAALAIVQRLAAADSANVRLDHDLVYIWSRIGDAKLAARDVAGALKAEEAALAIAEKLARDPVSHESQVALAQALGNHADGLKAAGKPDEARKQVARALGTLTPLLDKPDVPSAWTDLRTRLAKLQQELE